MSARTTEKVQIARLSDIEEIIDTIHRFEAERTLTNPDEWDIDNYLYLFNTVVNLVSLRDKINEIIDQVNILNGYLKEKPIDF